MLSYAKLRNHDLNSQLTGIFLSPYLKHYRSCTFLQCNVMFYRTEENLCSCNNFSKIQEVREATTVKFCFFFPFINIWRSKAKSNTAVEKSSRNLLKCKMAIKSKQNLYINNKDSKRKMDKCNYINDFIFPRLTLYAT